MHIIDLFAGPGGWDEGLKSLGHTNVLGIEWDAQACATARAAGHARLQADIAALNPADYSCDGLIASPPCQSYSAAGRGLGRQDRAVVEAVARELSEGLDERDRARIALQDSRSLLTVEPLRWALALRPRWIALEQVPAVLPLWELFADLLRPHGYHVATGKLSAEEYGVPQTRKRAYLIASLDGPVTLPRPTHQAYNPRSRGPKRDTEHRLPYVTMADALGWDATTIVNTRGNRAPGGGNEFSADAPSWAITSKARSWFFRSDAQAHATVRPGNAPAPTIKSGHCNGERRWVVPSGATERVTVQQVAILQSFRADYPWLGSRSAQFQQVGNAVPPVMAAVVAQAAMSAV